MALTRSDVEATVASVLAQVPDADVRLVGTASSVLRGIDVPANDVDILFRRRSDVDAWSSALTSEFDVDTLPVWLADAGQYFARMRVRLHGIVVELSTVEIECDLDTVECLGDGPWRHFDVLDCGEFSIPVVATELRLITEVSRGRGDRYEPMIDHLRVVGCDLALLRRGLTAADIAREQAEAVLTAVTR